MAVILLAVGLMTSGPLSVFLTLRYLTARDTRDQQEREQVRADLQHWANRVQAPDVAVAQAIHVPDTGDGYVSPFDDEGMLAELEEREANTVPT